MAFHILTAIDHRGADYPHLLDTTAPERAALTQWVDMMTTAVNPARTMRQWAKNPRAASTQWHTEGNALIVDELTYVWRTQKSWPRRVIVLTREEAADCVPATIVATSLPSALALATHMECAQVWVCGKGDLLREALAHPDLRGIYCIELLHIPPGNPRQALSPFVSLSCRPPTLAVPGNLLLRRQACSGWQTATGQLTFRASLYAGEQYAQVPQPYES